MVKDDDLVTNCRMEVYYMGEPRIPTDTSSLRRAGGQGSSIKRRLPEVEYYGGTASYCKG